MARIYKPKFPTYRTVMDADGNPIMQTRIATKGRNKGKAVESPKREPVRNAKGEIVYSESAKWYVEYHDEHGRRKRVPGYTDRLATEDLGVKLQQRAARIGEGTMADHDEQVKRPLADHITEWVAVVAARKENTRKHADMWSMQVRRVFDACRFKFWRDIRDSRVETKLAEFRDAGMSVTTSNHYKRAVKSFCEWMVSDQRAPTNRLANLKTPKATKLKHARRAFTDQELDWFLRCTDDGPDRVGITGHNRAMLYRLGAESGLRSNEIRSLSVGSFDLDGKTPTVTVEACYSKARREDRLPLRTAFASILREHFSGKHPRVAAFPMPRTVVRMLRADLADARARWINDAPNSKERTTREESTFLAYRDDSDRVLDFHALRHTYITRLCRAGIHPKTAQRLARHSTIQLTLDHYSHVEDDELAPAIETVPEIGSGGHALDKTRRHA